ncbi:MAG: hypothetical protein ABFR89_09280 [Actinomycetota bacterium]
MSRIWFEREAPNHAGVIIDDLAELRRPGTATPHVSTATGITEAHFDRGAVAHALHVLRDGLPQHRVNPEVRSARRRDPNSKETGS